MLDKILRILDKTCTIKTLGKSGFRNVRQNYRNTT